MEIKMKTGQMDFLEEMPIQARGTYEIQAEMREEDLELEETGPLLERLESKSWKTRAKAYQDLILDLQNYQSYAMYSAKIPKFLNDPNPNPQEKALEILRYYIRYNPDLLISQTEQIIKIMIEKHISGSRNSSKETAKELLSQLYNIEKEKAFHELAKYFDHKNAKFVGAAIIGLISILSSLGAKSIDLKLACKHMEKAAENTNALIRNEALNFYKELYKILHDGIEPFIANLKKQQQEELKKAFSSMEIAEKPAEGSYDFLDSKDIFIQFNEKWAEGVLVLRKWSEKKDALEEINKAASFPKLAEKNPCHLISMVKRLMNDSNIHVVSQAIRLVGNLAKGQKRYFEHFGKMMIPILLSKFRDKKPQIIQETHLALENILYSTSLENFLPHLEAALQDKTVSSKLNTISWLAKIVQLNKTNEETIEKAFLLIKQNIEDSNESVRECSYEALKAIINKFARCGELLSDIAEAKKKRICNTSGKDQQKMTGKNTEKDENKMDVDERKQAEPKKIQEKKSEELKKEESDKEISIEGIVPDAIIAQLKQKAWKARESGLQELKAFISDSLSTSNISRIHSFLLYFLNYFKESNPNIVKESLECLRKIYSFAILPEESFLQVLTPQGLDKLADIKTVDLYKACVLSICEVISPNTVVKKMISSLEDCSKPKTISESIDFIGIILNQFGIKLFNVRLLTDFIQKSLGNSNNLIKKSSCSLVKVLHLFLGDQVLTQLENVKELIIKSIKEDIMSNPLSMPSSFRSTKCKTVLQDIPDPGKKISLSSLVSPELISDLSNNNWQVRKEALGKLDSLLPKSIIGAGLGELLRAVKARLADPNKGLIKIALTVIGKFADSLSDESIGYSRAIIPAIMTNLSDKQQAVRQEAKVSIDKWGKNAGAEQVINHAGSFLVQDSADARTELLTWILNNRAFIPMADFRMLIPGIIACLQDRTTNIRNQAEVIFGEIVEIVGIDAVKPFTKDIKPAILQSLQEIFKKYSDTEFRTGKNKPGVKVIKSRFGENYEFLITEKDKKPRSEGIKWIFDEMRPDQVEGIRNEIKNCTNLELFNMLFNQDFKKRCQVCRNIQQMMSLEHFYQASEVIFKWVFLELNSSNQQVIKTVLELELDVLNSLKDKKRMISDLEAEIIIPSLCPKLSDSIFAATAGQIIKTACGLYNNERCYSLIITGMHSKSSVKIDCINILYEIYSTLKGNFTQKAMASLNKYLETHDINTKNAIIKLLSLITKTQGTNSLDAISKPHKSAVLSTVKAQNVPSVVIPKTSLELIFKALNEKDADMKINSLEFINLTLMPHFEEFKSEFCRLQTFIAENVLQFLRSLFSSPFSTLNINFIDLSLKTIANIFGWTDLLLMVDFQMLKQFYFELISRASQPANTAEVKNFLSYALVTMLDHTNGNDIINVIFELLVQDKNCEIYQISAKCLLKVAEMPEEFNLDIENCLVKVHEYLICPYILPDEEEPRTRTVKAFLQEIVFYMGESVWTVYDKLKVSKIAENKKITEWIEKILSVTYPLMKIFKLLNAEATYDAAIEELYRYLESRRTANLEYFMKRFPKISRNVINDLEKIRKIKNQGERYSSPMQNYPYSRRHSKSYEVVGRDVHDN